MTDKNSSGGPRLYVAPERRCALARHVPPGRTLHLVDIENLMGGPRAGAHAFSDGVEGYNQAAMRRRGDLTVVGTGPYLATVAHQAFPGADVRQRPGRDGAEQAILDHIRPFIDTATLFHRIVVGSGDGAFVEAAETFASLGLHVEVVARAGTIARDLRNAVHAVYPLVGPGPATQPVFR